MCECYAARRSSRAPPRSGRRNTRPFNLGKISLQIWAGNYLPCGGAGFADRRKARREQSPWKFAMRRSTSRISLRHLIILVAADRARTRLFGGHTFARHRKNIHASARRIIGKWAKAIWSASAKSCFRLRSCRNRAPAVRHSAVPRKLRRMLPRPSISALMWAANWSGWLPTTT
jgi:hypothetical protein